MPKTKNPEPQSTAQTTQQQGEMYLTSSGSPFVKPEINAQKLEELLGNPYVVAHLTKLRNLVFSDYYRIWVEDEKGETDEDLTQQMENIAESQGVRLWTTFQQMWWDRHGWGTGILNPVWGVEGGTKTIQQFRRLPPSSFTEDPPNMKGKAVYNPILRGITLDEGKNLVLYQTTEKNKPEKISNAVLVKDPTDTRLGGTSTIEPLVPILGMGNFSWKTLMQKLNREGAPILFTQIKGAPVKTGVIDDLKLLENINKNWGKDTSYTIRDNMTPLPLNFTPNNVTIQAIEKVENFLNNYFSPKSMLEREGVSLGESGGAKEDLALMWIRREHRWIEDCFEAIFQQQLDENLYKGYAVHIEINKPEKDESQTKLAQVNAGIQSKVLSVSEVRDRLGAPEKSEDELRKIVEEWNALFPKPVVPTFPFKNMGHTDKICKQEGEGEPTETMNVLEKKLIDIDQKFKRKVVKALVNENPKGA